MGTLGPGEIMLVLVVALIVLGPDKLPKAARQMGNALREIRRITSDVRTEVDKVVNEHDPRVDPPPPARPEPPSQQHPGTEGFELIDQHDVPAEETPKAPIPENKRDDS